MGPLRPTGPADLQDQVDRLHTDFYLYRDNRHSHHSKTADRYSYFGSHFDNRFDSYCNSDRLCFA